MEPAALKLLDEFIHLKVCLHRIRCDFRTKKSHETDGCKHVRKFSAIIFARNCLMLFRT